MSSMSSIPLPAAHALRKLGRDLALARRKRGISTRDMAARLFVMSVVGQAGDLLFLPVDIPMVAKLDNQHAVETVAQAALQINGISEQPTKPRLWVAPDEETP